jgi:hypothetical protein
MCLKVEKIAVLMQRRNNEGKMGTSVILVNHSASYFGQSALKQWKSGQ